MAPPFSGNNKLLDVFLHGTKDFDSDNTNYHLFGQYLMYKSLPTIMELRPKSMAAKIFTDISYKELGDAIRDRLEIERDCDISEIKTKTSKFDEIFEGYFPSLSNSECKFEENIGGNQKTLNRKCYTYIYNVGDCLTIITKSVNPTEENNEKDFYLKNMEKNIFIKENVMKKKEIV